MIDDVGRALTDEWMLCLTRIAELAVEACDKRVAMRDLPETVAVWLRGNAATDQLEAWVAETGRDSETFPPASPEVVARFDRAVAELGRRVGPSDDDNEEQEEEQHAD